MESLTHPHWESLTPATRALSYFDDAESLPMPQMIAKTSWSKMKKFLETKAIEAGRKRLADLWE